MKLHMSALKEAAHSVVDKLTKNGVVKTTKISIVPYVGAVNIGANNSQYIGKASGSKHEAQLIRGRWIGWIKNCGSSVPSWNTDDSGSTSDQSSLDIYNTFDALKSIFSISKAYAGDDGGPNPYVSGYQMCNVTNPTNISH